jgi:hypothetical protein
MLLTCLIVRKRTALILVGIFAAALAVAAYFIRRDKQVVVIDPWEAVPADAFFIVDTDDFPELLTSITDPSGILSGLRGMDWAASLVRSASVIDSVTGGREVRELISNRKMVISFHMAGPGRPAPLAVMSTGTMLTARKLTSLCEQSGGRVEAKRDLGGTRTFTVSYGAGSGRTSFYIALTAGIMIISPHESLVTAALDNRNAGSDVRHQQGFASVVNAAGKDADNIFILFRNLPGFIKAFIDTDMIPTISTAAIAGGGDLSITEGGLYISGFLSTAGAGTGADRLSEVMPAECGVHELLPRSTLSYHTVMRRASLAGETARDAASINATDLALILSPFTGQEVTEALITVGDGRERIRAFRMTDPRAAEKVLRERLAAKYRSMGLRESHFMASATEADGEESTLYRLPFTGVASILSGAEKSRAKDDWVTFERSYMIFSGSPEALARVLRESDSDNTLINDPGFREMEKSMPTKSSLLFWASGTIIGTLLSESLTPEAAAALDTKALSSLSGVALSLNPSGRMLYTSVSLRHEPGERQPGSVMADASMTAGAGQNEASDNDVAALRMLWRVKLEAEPVIMPYLFTNHNTGATEIFIQDRNNNIYLISSSGTILWKASIRERIRGDIFMIDYYKNRKLQLLFAGKDYMHLIDRNGNYVDKYPVKMRSPASNTLAVFDYESNKEYRLFLAGEDRNIYVYDRSGAPVKGWNLFTARGKVTDPVSFFRVRGKDYLFIADDQAVYVLDRTGNIRVAHQEPLMKAAGSAVRLTGGDEQAVIFTSPDGSTVRLMFDGTVKVDSLSGFSTEHRSDFADLDGDRMTDRVTLDRGSLMAYDGHGKGLWTYAPGSEQLAGPYIFSMGTGERRIAVYETRRGLLHLTGRNGTSVAGFPRNAGPFFNIGRVTGNSTWNLIVNENENYLCNYELTGGSK